MMRGVLILFLSFIVINDLSCQFCFKKFDRDSCRHVLFTEFELGVSKKLAPIGESSLALGFNLGYLYYPNSKFGSGPFSAIQTRGVDDLNAVVGYRFSFIFNKNIDLDISPGLKFPLTHNNYNSPNYSLSVGLMAENRMGVYGRYGMQPASEFDVEKIGLKKHYFTLGFRWRGSKAIVMGIAVPVSILGLFAFYPRR